MRAYMVWFKKNGCETVTRIVEAIDGLQAIGKAKKELCGCGYTNLEFYKCQKI